MCIATDGNFSTFLSPTDTVACCTGASCGFSQGCNGGQPAGAFSWFVESGVVSGGDYDDVSLVVLCCGVSGGGGFGSLGFVRY